MDYEQISCLWHVIIMKRQHPPLDLLGRLHYSVMHRYGYGYGFGYCYC